MSAAVRNSVWERKTTFVWLPLLLVAAFLVRSIGFELVFLDDGSLVYGSPDAFYHARRVFFTFTHFPSFLIRDPCINFPDGAVITHPPLHDWGVAAIARLFGSDAMTFARTSAWLPVLFGMLTLLPIHRIGRRLGGAGIGLGAAAIYTFMPIAIRYTRVGEIDHHAAAALLGAMLLALYVALLDEDESPGDVRSRFVMLGFARAGILLVWSGSLLYLVPGEIALLLAGVFRRRRALLIGQAASSAATFLLILPFVLLIGDPAGGHFATTELSRFHLLALTGSGLLCGGWLFAEQRLASTSVAVRACVLAAVTGGIAGIMLLIPDLRDALASGLSFLGKSDGYTESVIEQLPLFHEQGAIARAAGERRMGFYAYLISLVPLIYARRPERTSLRPATLLLFAWSLLFGYLAIEQVRYAHDYAAAGCVGFALILGWLRQQAISRGLNPRIASAAALALGVALFTPAIRLQLIPSARDTLQYLAAPPSPLDRGLYTISGTQLRFAQSVAAVTPAAGCEDATATPAYGILTHPSLGHALHHVAQRATPADPFGPYIGRENFSAVQRFLTTDSESEAISIARQLSTPYVVTAQMERVEKPARIHERLQWEDGSAQPGLAHLAHFRLVTEGPVGGTPLAAGFASTYERAIPYKLFEVVEGALIEVPAEPGSWVFASLPLTSDAGRRFVFEAAVLSGSDGLARLRVPYATSGSSRTRAGGRYRVRTDDRTWRVAVDEVEIVEGRTVSLLRAESSVR